MEYLDKSLYDLLTENNNIGFDLGFIQKVMKSVLQTLAVFDQLQIIHCDIKPENILRCIKNKDEFKIIDFGLCSLVDEPTNHHIQSRYYRAPEVVLDMPFSCKADIWSAGCVAAEMFFGVPIFPANCEVHLIYLIDRMVGPFQNSFIQNIDNPGQLFTRDYKLKSVLKLNQYATESFEEGHSCFIFKSFKDNAMSYRGATDINISFEMDTDGNSLNFQQLTYGLSEKEINDRVLFIDFVLQMLHIDPDLRPSPDILLEHPFILADFH